MKLPALLRPLAAFGGLVLLDPGRGAAEGGAAGQKAGRPRMKDYLELFRTRTFLYNTAGMAAVTFATGAYGAWGLLFYHVHGPRCFCPAGVVKYRSAGCWWSQAWSGSRWEPLSPTCFSR